MCRGYRHESPPGPARRQGPSLPGRAPRATVHLRLVEEALQLEEVISATAGIELSGGSFVALARAVKAIIADDRLVADLESVSGQLNDALGPHHGKRIRGLDEVLAAAVEVGQGRVDRAL